jgi:MFS family permease
VVRLHGLSVAGTSSRQGHFCSQRFVLARDELGIFGAAFLARPIGAILFGHLGDRFGRKRALVTSALLMALAKMVEGLLPTYSTAGHLAPAIFLVARIASGFSLGGEFTGAAVMLFESTQPGRRGLTTSLANIMGGVGVFLVSGLVGLLTINLSPAVMESWGLVRPLLRRLTHRSGGTRHSRSRSGNTPLREIAEQGKNGPDTFARESKRPTAPSFSHSR